MPFHTGQFGLLLAATAALFYLAGAGRPRVRRTILLTASYLFYASWNPAFLPLLWALTAIDYAAARWLEVRRERWALIASLGANLAFLAFFKYYNFGASIAAQLLGRPASAFALDIVLPLGISFHTFQSISYVVDVYRGRQRAVTNVLDYALFIAFFPQLVAGPIVRAREFFGDLLPWRVPTREEMARGAFLCVLGLTKKMALADNFARVSDAYFAELPSGLLTAWGGAAAFGLQIYFDFSGYTDMAIGMAKLFGFHFPENFRRPYLATSITDFWRRWHISLSSWLRDYLYIPLGGNRGSRLATYRNLMLTMLLGGLWHGASWTFVLWGGYHGALLAGERALGMGSAASQSILRAAPTFLLVTLGWVLFRAPDAATAGRVFKEMFAGEAGTWPWNAWQTGLALAGAAAWITEERSGWVERLSLSPGWRYSAALTGLLLVLEMFGVTDTMVPFVYFQF